MIQLDLRKIYIFTPIEPAPDPASLPLGADIYYECQSCHSVINSVPFLKCACQCGNLAGAGGKTTITRPHDVRVMRGKLK